MDGIRGVCHLRWGGVWQMALYLLRAGDTGTDIKKNDTKPATSSTVGTEIQPLEVAAIHSIPKYRWSRWHRLCGHHRRLRKEQPLVLRRAFPEFQRTNFKKKRVFVKTEDKIEFVKIDMNHDVFFETNQNFDEKCAFFELRPFCWTLLMRCPSAHCWMPWMLMALDGEVVMAGDGWCFPQKIPEFHTFSTQHIINDHELVVEFWMWKMITELSTTEGWDFGFLALCTPSLYHDLEL